MNNKGFTLIELIAAITIMIIISVIVTVNLSKISDNNEEKRYSEFKQQVADAACIYIDLSKNRSYKEGCYNNCTVNVNDLISEGMVSSDLINPKTDEPIDSSLTVSVVWDNDGVKSCTLNITGE